MSETGGGDGSPASVAEARRDGLRARRSEERPGRRKLSESRGVHLPDIKILQPGPGGDEKRVLFRADSGPPATPSTAADSPMTLVQNRQASTSPKELGRSLMELRVFLPDHRALRFPLHDGSRASTGQLSALVYSELGLEPAVGAEAFALWMVSPLLEVQLKPHHQPFQLRLAWAELLAKFTTATASERETDEPLLLFRRSVLLSKARQRSLVAEAADGSRVAELLFLDARECILTGKYPVEAAEALELAALDLALTQGPWDAGKHTPAFLRSVLEEFLPEAHLGRLASTTLFGLPLPGLRGQEEEILRRYAALAEIKAQALRAKYLEIAMELPYYGAAFFAGQMEPAPQAAPKGRLKLLRRASGDPSDLPVQVAISREFVTILDRREGTALAVESLLDCRWRRSEPKSPSSEAQLPSLFLQVEGEKEGESRLLQIFTKQAAMAEALFGSLIQAGCREESALEEEAEEAAVEAELFPPLEALPQTELLRRKLERVCVATFREDGECLEAQGSLALCLFPKEPKS